MSFTAWVALATIPLWAVAIILRRRRLRKSRDPHADPYGDA